MIQSKNPIAAMSVIFLSFVLGYFTKEVLCILGNIFLAAATAELWLHKLT